MPPFQPNQPAPPPSAGAPPPAPSGPPSMQASDRIAQLTPEEIEMLKADPAVVEIIKKIAPEYAADLDALMAQGEQGEQGEDDDEAQLGPQQRLPRPVTKLGQM